MTEHAYHIALANIRNDYYKRGVDTMDQAYRERLMSPLQQSMVVDSQNIDGSTETIIVERLNAEKSALIQRTQMDPPRAATCASVLRTLVNNELMRQIETDIELKSSRRFSFHYDANLGAMYVLDSVYMASMYEKGHPINSDEVISAIGEAWDLSLLDQVEISILDKNKIQDDSADMRVDKTGERLIARLLTEIQAKSQSQVEPRTQDIDICSLAEGAELAAVLYTQFFPFTKGIAEE